MAEGKVDAWSFSGKAGDQIVARVTTRDDTGTGVSTLHPLLTMLDAGNTTVADTNVRNANCGVANVCGSSCPVLKRTLPFIGTFRPAVQAFAGDSCTGGKYKLVLIAPGGTALTKVADDVDPF